VDGAKPASAEPNLIDEHGSPKAFYQAVWRTESKLPGAVTCITGIRRSLPTPSR
jgi:hypothetical protein